mmetsp:Transcript_71422/g.186208  ORF Transcript_71422/g.186208 Transcript_71422/m.186208 type:complete len:212 (-) Transcript_71422:35-670(-)
MERGPPLVLHLAPGSPEFIARGALLEQVGHAPGEEPLALLQPREGLLARCRHPVPVRVSQRAEPVDEGLRAVGVADLQGLAYLEVSLDVGPGQRVEQPAPVRHPHDQPPAAEVVVVVLAAVDRQCPDHLSQLGDLHRDGTARSFPVVLPGPLRVLDGDHSAVRFGGHEALVDNPRLACTGQLRIGHGLVPRVVVLQAVPGNSEIDELLYHL